LSRTGIRRPALVTSFAICKNCQLELHCRSNAGLVSLLNYQNNFACNSDQISVNVFFINTLKKKAVFIVFIAQNALTERPNLCVSIQLNALLAQ